MVDGAVLAQVLAQVRQRKVQPPPASGLNQLSRNEARAVNVGVVPGHVKSVGHVAELGWAVVASHRKQECLV
jgi:hypothetical protein